MMTMKGHKLYYCILTLWKEGQKFSKLVSKVISQLILELNFYSEMDPGFLLFYPRINLAMELCPGISSEIELA